MIRLGVDLGGTKTELVALDQRGDERLRERVATPQGYAETLEMLVALVDRARGAVGEEIRVGMGTPGAISPTTGLIKNANSTWLNGRPLLKDLESALACPVRISNDANCFALSEATDGAGEGKAVVFGVIIGTGTGGGFVINDRVLTGPNAIAGEWGHNPLPWCDDFERSGPECYTGKRGVIETFLSGPGMVADHLHATGEALEPPTIAARAEQRDRECEATLDRYIDRMARALAHVINLLDPDVIVLGGGMSNIRRLYTEVPRRWAPYVFSDRVDTLLLPPFHGDSSGVRGAAWLWDIDPR